MWHVTWHHLSRGHWRQSLSLFAENKFTARDWGLVIRSVIGSRWHQQQIATWTVLSGTCGLGKQMSHWESHPGWWSVVRGRWSERMRDQRLDKRLEAEGVALWCTDRHLVWATIIGFSCYTQLSWKRRVIPRESVAYEPGVAEYQIKEKLCAL